MQRPKQRMLLYHHPSLFQRKAPLARKTLRNADMIWSARNPLRLSLLVIIIIAARGQRQKVKVGVIWIHLSSADRLKSQVIYRLHACRQSKSFGNRIKSIVWSANIFFDLGASLLQRHWPTNVDWPILWTLTCLSKRLRYPTPFGRNSALQPFAGVPRTGQNYDAREARSNFVCGSKNLWN